MSGSGSTIFGIFETRQHLLTSKIQIPIILS
ncbi:MAG: hypothetical protein HQ517_07215 [SAR324 cluster bacterium]|nr:hypothetical protein [SAR324 cluster bacterium]